ncbi:MAG: Formate C-acetyltransferase [Candidatus Pacebacteria bacterium GW2011_GWF2_38_9]|nr:MAG: formate acetyltransferase, formate C-acetyltransferase [candidate division TM6 bacterium GW2011_GWF2_28_16]KKQ10240.1 MAG: Formate C-acetyltransferase [Candidatus Pacebacteria bacterium GW2011_GWF1_36_5]KKQ88800.1 MAG: Formate C-acetyltransferase [Candidatus Pacebacteria bacterium GW2011_GWF2_38_9]HAZ73260.1 formate C-acetyltransferase [Candidatus Paceibacterota bacterium]
MSFRSGKWQEEINTRDFILNNFTPYDGDNSFLKGPTEATKELWQKSSELLQKEMKNGGILDIDTKTISSITSHKPGYLDKKIEKIVGFQTDAPLKRAMKPYGGIRVVEAACEENGYKVDPAVSEIFNKYRKSHNDGVFDVYTKTMRQLRSTGILTGLPDNYARGRIIGDYRRVALYGIDRLVEAKKADKETLDGVMTDDLIRLREEISEQIKALGEMKEMALSYGFDISKPAKNAQEAIQWTWFGFLAALKEQDGAAMSLGNVSTFFDVYIERDLKNGNLTEVEAQELVDHFIMKCRLIRHLRMDAYNELFAGDPTWITEAIGGFFSNGQHKITKTSFRFLQSLYNIGPAPEPNLTILWSDKLPKGFKKFAAQVSIDTSSLQYENDSLMREAGNCDDYCIACCVSMMETGKEMQFFGARCNLAKALLMALNEGRDEISGELVVTGIEKMPAGPIKYEEFIKRFKQTVAYLAKAYVNTMDVIHYMHDKYYYEKAQMALMDTEVKRNMAFGMAGLSVVADSISAIKFAKVTPIRNEEGLTTGFETEGEFPMYGNDDDRVDTIAQSLVSDFNKELAKQHIYRDATPTLSILTITSNVVYGKKTGSTPDGRKKGEPFAPGANPMHGRDHSGAIASLNSVAKIDYHDARDGVSNTFSIVPKTLGENKETQVNNLLAMLDGYFNKNAHHLNVNVLNRETLEDAMKHPEKYPQLTIRVSGYAVNFVRLSEAHQREVIARTFHESM